MAGTPDLRIAPVTAQDIALLERYLANGPPGKHRARLARQERGEVAYLIARRGARPLGHVLLKWAGTADEPAASALVDCPDLEDLRVSPTCRGQGIGSRLLAAAEELARQRGHAQVGLGVAVSDLRVRALYERLGYRDAGLGEYVEGGRYLDRDGREQTWEETCIYLVKLLRTESEG